MKILAAVIGTLVVLAAAALLLIYSGAYDVAASEDHSAPVEWALETIMERSVAARADEIRMPALDDPAMLQEGFHEYDEMCAVCHSAPGERRTNIAQGLNPRAPNLARAADQWTPQELFWITKHGVKMTGMPAFGPTHSDATIWSIVAFVRRLPQMSPEEYGMMKMQAGGGSGESGETASDGHQHTH
jgi:mono/diheme cytochrome c family protein